MDITEQLTHESRIALAAVAEIIRLRAEVEALKAENAALASWQCLFTDGTTGLYHDGCGNAQCARDHLVVHLTAEVEALRADAERVKAVRLTESEMAALIARLGKYADRNGSHKNIREIEAAVLAKIDAAIKSGLK